MYKRPSQSEYASNYEAYVEQASSEDILGFLSNSSLSEFLEPIPQDKWDYSYAPGKWTIKEIIGHLVDTERIFTYRALRIARKDTTPIPGFEQDDYVENAQIAGRSPSSLIHEFDAVRKSTFSLFNSFNADQVASEGTASEKVISVNALAYLIIGHQKHHFKIMQERYL